MDAIQIAAALARRFEGLYLSPYLCPAGVPTIGYGFIDGVRPGCRLPPGAQVAVQEDP